MDDLGRTLASWPHCRQVARHTLHALGYKIVHYTAERGRLPRLAQDALKINGEERQLLWTARDLARQRGIVSPGELDVLDEQAEAPPNLPWYLDLYKLHEEVRHERGWLTEFGRRYDAAIYEMTDNFRCQASQVVLANRVIAQNGEALTRELGRVAPAPAADVGRGLAGMEEGGGETVDWGPGVNEDSPVLFFQAGMFHTWYAKRSSNQAALR